MRGQGPLAGLRVLEFASLGPGPFCGMLLADLGADVLRVDPPQGPPMRPFLPEARADLMARGRRVLRLDLRQPSGLDRARLLAARADVLIEGRRPGVMERLGLGPDVLLAANPRLVYGRVTGWGRAGPLAPRAGHDINFIALSGVLHAIGPRGGAPSVPLNLLGDFAGGGLLLACGLLAALHERQSSGRGQVVDTAMAQGAALLATFVHGLMAAGLWQDRRGENLLDGGAPFYTTYECADGGHVAVGALEPAFYAELLAGLGLGTPDDWPQQRRDRWPELRERMARRFRERSRDEWAAQFADGDACVTPVLALGEAGSHPQHRANQAFRAGDGIMQPAPAPQFSRTPAAAGAVPGEDPDDWQAIAAAWGID